ncbi:PREDICTED: uncharacterized protein LOC103336347 [Prunus mume]|uniref:Uncharacterized protein LOC103336347 n=1 Tax=Prunus mume TaxID=102107 RepID=A0ABM0PCG8_PRUMU|nr:PREDICTED: uncharacterized protein LOC103336347 [Prunus mume]
MAERKIYFIMCSVYEQQPEEAWSSLVAMVRAEKSSALNYEAASRPGKVDNKAEMRGKHDAVGVLGLIPEQKLTVALRMLAYGASAEQVDEIARMKKSTILECLWKNCPTTWQGEYGNWKGKKSIILEAVASFDCWVWHAFIGVAGSQNNLNVLGQSPVFDEVLRGHSPQVTYQINNTVYSGAYYLADKIYSRWKTFVKTIPNPQSEKERSFVSFQEGYRKDVEKCFGILQARWAIIRGATRMLDEEVLRSIMMTCIILHNMIVEDEYDYDAPEMFEPDPMNTTLTRIYERPMGPNGLPMEHKPLLRDGRFNNPMIDRYQEMQSSYIHKRRQVDLIEHLWEIKGNHNR